MENELRQVYHEMVGENAARIKDLGAGLEQIPIILVHSLQL